MNDLNEYQKKLEQKSVELSANKEAQKANWNDANQLFNEANNSITDKSSSEDEIKVMELEEKRKQETEKLYDLRVEFCKNIEEQKMHKEYVEKLQSSLTKYEQEYERLSQLETQYDKSLTENTEMAPNMRDMIEQKYMMCQSQKKIIEISMNMELTRYRSSLDKKIENLSNKLNDNKFLEQTEKEQAKTDDQKDQDGNVVEFETVTEQEENNTVLENESEKKPDDNEQGKTIDSDLKPEKRKPFKKFGQAGSIFKEMISNNNGKAILAIAGSIAAVTLILTNPALVAAIPVVYAANEFKKGKKL